MKKRIYFLIIALCLCAVASYVQAADFSPNTTTVTAAGGPIKVNITAGLGESWTVARQDPLDLWITLPRLPQGVGGGAIEITIAPNTTSSPQVGILTITGGGTFTIT